MTNTKPAIINLRLFAACWSVIAVASFYTAAGLPAGTQLPIHWNIALEPDRFANHWFAILMLPGVSILVGLLLTLLPRIEPRQENLARSALAYQGVFWGVQVFLLVLQIFIINLAWGWNVDLAHFIASALAVLYLTIGNYLGKTRSTHLFGLRTPWTLSSEDIWRKTHRVTGRSLFALGLLQAIIIPWATAATLMMSLTMLFVTFAAATLYSFRLWRLEQSRS